MLRMDTPAIEERLREHLEIERWLVFGGSWGSTLALAYAQANADRVTELVLRGIFLLRKREIRWFYQQGADAIFPDAWEDYIAPIPTDEHGDLLRAYYTRLTSDDPTVRLAAAKAWSLGRQGPARCTQTRRSSPTSAMRSSRSRSPGSSAITSSTGPSSTTTDSCSPTWDASGTSPP